MKGIDFPEAGRRPGFSVAITMCHIEVPGIIAQQPIPFINETGHEKTKRVDIRANLTICFRVGI